MVFRIFDTFFLQNLICWIFLSISVEDFLKLSAILGNYQQNYRHWKELICWYFPETESRRRKKYDCFMLSFKETTINLNHSFYIMSNGTRNKVRTDSLKTFLKPSLIRTIVACWEILLSKAFKKGAAKSQHSAVSFAAKCRLVRRWCAVRSRLSLKMMEILLSKV